jgi:hypothetical protein
LVGEIPSREMGWKSGKRGENLLGEEVRLGFLLVSGLGAENWFCLDSAQRLGKKIKVNRRLSFTGVLQKNQFNSSSSSLFR